MKKLMRFFTKIIMCGALMFAMPAFSATNTTTTGDIGDYGTWATDHNKDILTGQLTRDLNGFHKVQLVDNYVPVEAKAGLAFMNALSMVGEILDTSLVRFMIIFIVLAYMFWIMFEAYQMMTTKSNVRELAEKIVKKGALIAIWIIVLRFGPGQIFMWVMGPIVTVGTYMSDLILNAVAAASGASLPDTCGAIREYATAHTSARMTIDANAAADMLCVPTRLSGFFYTAVVAGFKWMLAGIGHSMFTFVVGLTFVVLFVYLGFKFAFMALGVIADLFLAVFMLPFTAVVETVGKTSYKGIAGTIYNGFLGLFKVESLQSQIMRFINAAIYFVSLSIVIAVCGALLAGAVDADLATHVPSINNSDFFVTLLTAMLVAYLANRADEIAKKIGGSIDASMGDKIKQDGKKLLNNVTDTATKWYKIIRKGGDKK